MTTQNDDARRILELLANGKISVDDAGQLLRAVGARTSSAEASPTADDKGPKSASNWMRITIDKAPCDGRPARQVNIRVPVALVKSGVRFGGMFPRMAGERLRARLRDQGIDIDRLDLSQLDSVLANLGETTIDDGRSHVRITYE
jgi:hypothetical protein